MNAHSLFLLGIVYNRNDLVDDRRIRKLRVIQSAYRNPSLKGDSER